MDRQFGFDFEARGKRWKTLDEAAGERTVAGENVAESVAEKRTIESVEQPVAERMAGAMRLVIKTVAVLHNAISDFALEIGIVVQR